MKTLTTTRHNLLFVRRIAATHQAASAAIITHQNQNQNTTVL